MSPGSSEHWRRVEDLCDRALALDARERHAFLAGACGADAGLQREVESLLAHASKAEDFLNPSDLAAAAHVVVNPPAGLLTGRRIGTYEIRERLGVGGMGEVYRARDTKLGRDVAIKVLPPAFTADSDRLARFEREARVLASLNHPNIAAIYGLEPIGDVQALVLELVEGETLDEKLRSHQPSRGLGIPEALAIARQIADGLEAAHEKGIVHRDLKPANIKVTPAGTVKVLDFGLAKSSAGSAPDLSQSPTITISGTRDGVLLGTAAYMSPEQARGQTVDKRADIWAFGCVLFEMLTGRGPFPGATVSDHIAAILEREPDWSAVPASAPPAIQRLLRRCLEKDPKQRLHDIADARIEIDEALIASPAVSASEQRRLPSNRLAWSAAAVLLAALTGLTAWIVAVPRGLSAPRQTSRFVVHPPATSPIIAGFALSPDGSQLVYGAKESAGTPTRLFLKRSDQFDAVLLAGTDGAATPFFSPDGQWIGFHAGGTLKKISATAAAAPITLCEVAGVLGAAWTADDTIIIGQFEHGLQQVSASGCQLKPITTIDRGRHEIDHHNPELLPGGEALLFTIHEAGDVFRLGVQSLASGQRHVLVDQGFDAHYLPTGHLVYANGKSVLAVAFNPQTLQVSGNPVTLLDDVATVPDSGIGGFSVSKSGSLIFLQERSRTPSRTLVWVDRSGTEKPLPLARRPFMISRLSPNGRQIAFTAMSPSARAGQAVNTADIWTYDIATDRARRASFDSYSVAPVWTPDGLRLTYTATRGDSWHLLSVPADGSASPQSLVANRNEMYAATWTPDGRTLLYNERLPGHDQVATIDPGGEPRALSFGRGPSFDSVSGPALSPDGRWLAFVGFEARREDLGNIYVEPFQRTGPRFQVTVDGGIQPLWRRDGREVFYRHGDGVYAVAVEAGREFAAGKPVLLFRGAYRRGAPISPDYDVTADGQRFLMVKMGDDELAPRHLNVVLNWADEVTRRVPTSRR